MKFNLLCGAALAALFSMSAGAQTCGAPDTTWHPDAGGSPDLTGTTCGHETGLISACESNFGAPGAAYVAQVSTAASGTYTSITVTGEPANYAASLYIVSTTSSPTPCDVGGSGDTGHCATSSSVAVQRANIPDGGTYYVIVTGADFDTAGACGAFALHANGTLPVSLQSFTVS
jgi:hypothetical protein